MKDKSCLIQIILVFPTILLGWVVERLLLSGLSNPWRAIICGLVYVVIFFVLYFIVETIRATKDPDVQDASNLRMDIRLYRTIKRFDEELMGIAKTKGTRSQEFDDKMSELLQLVSYDQFKRYQDYMEEKQMEQIREDPDAYHASVIGMSVERYREYKVMHDELMDIYEKYGIDSREAMNKIKDILRQEKFVGEWKIFSEYSFQESRRKGQEELERMFSDDDEEE